MAGNRINEDQPAVRKSFLVIGGVAIGTAVLAFVVMNFIVGGDSGDGEEASTISTTQGSPAPTSSAEPSLSNPLSGQSEGLRPGGRDPFSPTGAQASATDTQVQASVEENAEVVVTVFTVYGQGADVQVGEEIFEGARPNDKLSDGVVVKGIDGKCVSFDREGQTFSVCEGQRAQH
ncbi:MAG: hypothetical protein WD646_03240 [Actinomycetota bacterium]